MLDEALNFFLSSEKGKHLSWITVSVLGILWLVTFTQTLMTWHDDFFILQRTQALHNAFVESDLIARQIALIPRGHLFGQEGAKDDAGLPITSLQLRLVGLIQKDPPNLSAVIISVAGQVGKVYQVGDTLFGDVRIVAITSDGAVLGNGHRLEKLPLQRVSVVFQGLPASLGEP